MHILALNDLNPKSAYYRQKITGPCLNYMRSNTADLYFTSIFSDKFLHGFLYANAKGGT